jgi:hypothetical protein
MILILILSNTSYQYFFLNYVNLCVMCYYYYYMLLYSYMCIRGCVVGYNILQYYF